MPPQLLTITVHPLDAGRARLRLTGDLDFDTAPELVAAAADARRDGHQHLLIDLSEVGLCDSSGLSALVVVHRAGTGPIELTGVGPSLQALLARTGLAELLAVAPPVVDGQAVREVG
ncbi:STAS domain-containing protein [Micromonospora sp. PLK6-60]|uniref:STAS domain-containing protein n=1 Tax=Micromonospora sp. PLK6-60 TaxID=2873383 RepID=UPI001CA786A7|nr:STAS domain-containing protein [Micromonospora sp. PLK6-60]MBY8874698.1 STAS domain-containing protein [Micromonospora sp. PLK6-60]